MKIQEKINKIYQEHRMKNPTIEKDLKLAISPNEYHELLQEIKPLERVNFDFENHKGGERKRYQNLILVVSHDLNYGEMGIINELKSI